jgi:hypothetical protein
MIAYRLVLPEIPDDPEETAYEGPVWSIDRIADYFRKVIERHGDSPDEIRWGVIAVEEGTQRRPTEVEIAAITAALEQVEGGIRIRLTPYP